MYPESILTADVGGTHTRFAMVTVSDTASWKLTHRLEIGGQLPDFPSMLRAYLARCDLGGIPERAVIAAAGPVVSGKVELTNRSLQISEPELLQFGFARARLINDFAALAFAADVLGPQDLHTIGLRLMELPERRSPSWEPAILSGTAIQSPAAKARSMLIARPEKTSANVLWSASPKTIANRPEVASTPDRGCLKTLSMMPTNATT